MGTRSTAVATVLLAVSAWLGTVAVGAPTSAVELTVGPAGVLADADLGGAAALPAVAGGAHTLVAADGGEPCLLRRMFEARVAL